MSSSTGAPPQGTENSSKRRESGSKEFIGTPPGLLAGVAALITAIAGAFYGGTQLAGRPQVQPTVFVTVTARASSPMTVTAKLSNAKDGYHVRAQLLAGGGTVTVGILVNGNVLSTGTASGGYHIAWAQICPGPTTGQWQSCN